MKYTIMEQVGGCEETVEALDVDGAIKKAQAWLNRGDWGETETYVTLKITDESGNETEVECVVGGASEPECLEGEEHQWLSPPHLVGGISENPGVWSLDGGRLNIVEVCGNCGCYRDRITQSLCGQWPRTPEQVTYRDADQKSLAWAGLIEADEDE